MRYETVRSVVVASALAVLVTGGAAFSAGCGLNPLAAVPVSAEPSKEPKTSKPAARSEAAPYLAAAEQNVRLANEISWSFAGRAQHGWAIYEPLVASYVGADADASTPEFALAVATWQKAHGVRPADGVVTLECWQRMMRAMQSERAFDAAPPPAAELVDTAAADWYDAGRAPELRMLRRDAYEAYRRMVEAARADLGPKSQKYLTIVSGYRSPEYQAGLREKAGNPSTATLAIHSPHTTGRALDLYVGGDPVSTADANRAIQVATPAYRWLARNAKRFGFRPYFYEPWHWEFDPRLAASAK
jgi:D-alanyl-D-alanine carboxypeptidase